MTDLALFGRKMRGGREGWGTGGEHAQAGVGQAALIAAVFFQREGF